MFSKLTMAKVATPVNSNISAGSNQAQFLAMVGGKAAALIQTNLFGCSFGSRRLNWLPVAASSVFYCSLTM